jgi:hypothetical protein
VGARRASAGPEARPKAGLDPPRGTTAGAGASHRYEWLYVYVYVYGFVRPATGESFWVVLPTLPTVNKELLSVALREFAEWVGASEDKRVLLAIDQAGWHTSKDVTLAEGIHLVKVSTW